METTVTMSLSEYKLMEAKIKAFERIQNGTKGPMVIDNFHCYYGDFIVVDDEANSVLLSRLKETIAARDAAYEKIKTCEREIEHLEKMQEEDLQDTLKRSWFKK